jgi:hypothetical protein
VKLRNKIVLNSNELIDCASAGENFSRTLSQVMKLGFMAVMSKQKPSLRTGSQKCHPQPKELGKFGPK